MIPATPSVRFPVTINQTITKKHSDGNIDVNSMLAFYVGFLSTSTNQVSMRKSKPLKTQRFQGLVVVCTGLEPVTPSM